MRHEEFAPAWVRHERPASGAGVTLDEIRLDRGATLRARLLVEDRPFAGEVEGRLTYDVPGSRNGRPVGLDEKRVTLEDGLLVVERLPLGRANLLLEPAGHNSIRRQELTLTDEGPLDLGEIGLDPGHRILGTVLDPDGKPVAGVKVQALSIRMGEGMVRKLAETADDGTFALGGLTDPEATFRISVTVDGYGRATVQDVKPDSGRVEVRLQPAGKIRGRVLAGDPPRPVAGFTVEPHGKSLQELPLPMPVGNLGGKPMRFREPDGTFELSNLSEGTYGIKVDAPGWMTFQKEKIEVSSGETVDLGELVLEAGATLHGVVSEAGTMKPVGGATVKLEKPGLFDFSGMMGRDDGSARLTGPDGAFTVSGLPPGTHTFRVEHEGYAPRTAEVEIAAGVPPGELSVELGAGGAIEGTLRTSAGELMPGGIVMVMRGFTPDPNGMITTDSYGHYRIDRLAPGSYRVMAMPQPGEGADASSILGQMKMQMAEVVDGQTTIVNLPPDTGGVTVTGVVRRGARPVAARMFWVRTVAGGAAPDDFAVATSDESGAYEVRLASSGDYQVAIQQTEDRDRDLSTMDSSVKVSIPRETPQVTRDIEIPDVLLAGTVLDGETGQPLSGVSVQGLERGEDPSVPPTAVSSAVTDAEGRYELLGLGEGEFWLSVSKRGYAAEMLGPLDLDESSREEGVNAALFSTEGCMVRVLTDAGHPVEGAFVSPVVLGIFGGWQGAQTGPEGEALLASLGEGSHDVGVVTAGLAPKIVEGVVVGGEERARVDVTLRRGVALVVALLDEEERPVSNAAILVREVDGPDLTSLLQLTAVLKGRGLLTDANGTLRIPNLEPGRYEIEARWQDRTVIDKVRVKGRSENRVELQF